MANSCKLFPNSKSLYDVALFSSYCWCMHAIYLINFTFDSLVSIVVDVREVAEAVGSIAIEGILGDIFLEGI